MKWLIDFIVVIIAVFAWRLLMEIGLRFFFHAVDVLENLVIYGLIGIWMGHRSWSDVWEEMPRKIAPSILE